jgi:hypothetical protein
VYVGPNFSSGERIHRVRRPELQFGRTSVSGN